MRRIISSSFFVLSVLIIFVFTTSCNFQKEKNNTENFPDVEFSYNLVDWDKTINYDGTPISLTLEIYNNEAYAEFGIMIFINGIIQEFTTNEHTECKYMQKYNFQSKQQKTIEISLSPQSVNIGEYELVVIMLINPSFMATEPNYVFGYNHKISYAYTNIKINSNTDLKLNTMTVEKSNIIDDTEKNKYISDNINRLELTAYCIMMNENKEENRKIFLNGNDLNVNFKVLGGSSAKYRVTTFINHEPILINEKYNNAILESSFDRYSIFSCDYANVKLQEQNVIYSIAIPIDNIKDNSFPIKSDSVVIIK